MMRPESEDEARRVRMLTDEVREPPASVTVTQTETDVTFSDDHGRSRTFHPNGKEEVIDLGGVPIVAIARWEGAQFVVLYEVEQGRQLRYAFSRLTGPDRLSVDAQFIDHGKGDHVTRVYQPAAAATQAAAIPGAGTGQPPPQGQAPPPSSPSEPVNSQPGAEFKGISTIGLVVEDLSAQSTRCGLVQTVIEGLVYKHLTDGGLHVRRNADDDTYVYVNIKTATVAEGVCVSRYDVFLTTHTTAKLSYQPSPVLVDVTLFHKGSLAGGSPGVAGRIGPIRGDRRTSTRSLLASATPTSSPEIERRTTCIPSLAESTVQPSIRNTSAGSAGFLGWSCCGTTNGPGCGTTSWPAS